MREISVSRGRFVALVDDEDYERIAAHKWHIHASGYAHRWSAGCGSQRIRMHRAVLGITDSTTIIDHANGSGLDNRRCNLRICTAADNARNARALRHQHFKGIQRCVRGLWRARIRIDGKLTHLGVFKNEIDAALAYDAAAREFHGEFACVNYPRAGERPAIIAA
jgi:hypothetical protein